MQLRLWLWLVVEKNSLSHSWPGLVTMVAATVSACQICCSPRIQKAAQKAPIDDSCSMFGHPLVYHKFVEGHGVMEHDAQGVDDCCWSLFS